MKNLFRGFVSVWTECSEVCYYVLHFANCLSHDWWTGDRLFLHRCLSATCQSMHVQSGWRPDFPDLTLSLQREVTRERNSRVVKQLTAACGAAATFVIFLLSFSCSDCFWICIWSDAERPFSICWFLGRRILLSSTLQISTSTTTINIRSAITIGSASRSTKECECGDHFRLSVCFSVVYMLKQLYNYHIPSCSSFIIFLHVLLAHFIIVYMVVCFVYFRIIL